MHRCGNALEVLRAEVLQLKQRAEKFFCVLSDDDCVWLSHPLQAPRQIGRLAHNAALLCLPRSDQVADHNEARCYADTGLQRSTCLERGYCRDQFQPGAHRPLGVILMGLGVTEINKRPVAQILRQKAAEAAHRIGDALLIGRDDLAQILRVHSCGERCRTD